MDREPGRDDDALLTTAQVAQMLGTSTKTVILMAKDGRLPARRIPGVRRYMFWRHEILQLIDRNIVNPASLALLESEKDANDEEDVVTGE